MDHSTPALLGGRPVRTKPFPSWPVFDAREERLLLDTLHSGKWFRFHGDKVRQFEQAFAKRHDAKYGLAVSSGTTALEASICALNLEPGAEVLVPSYTFVATASSVVVSGATPRFVDVCPETLNIDLKHAEQCVSPRTRAIVVVHFAGLPCNMDEVKAFAAKHNLYVVEDAAHAHGARWDGKGVGSHGHIGAFSFQASKNMTAGEGGIILTDDEKLMERAFSRHTYGQRPGFPWYSHHVVSTNLRMTEWQGSVLLAQLERLDEHMRIRRQNALLLDEAIARMPGLAPVKPDDPRAADRAYHLYPFRYAPGVAGLSRERFAEALQAEGIPCSLGYPVPLYKQPMFRHVQHPPDLPPYHELELPNVTRLCNEVIWLTQNLLLGTEEDTRDIIRAIEKVLANADKLAQKAS